jgi:sulfate adenylyltransferase subunit 2
MRHPQFSHLRQLEAESVHIFREVVAECERPVLLYSIGKDSSVLVHLARKAFAPAPLPFPLLHIDTTLKFPEMIAFRDNFARDIGAELIVHTNHRALPEVGSPAGWNCSLCADLLKTQALVEALQGGGFDAAFGGARRDEERSRAKERVLSFRDGNMQWDPKNQRPELWDLFNTSPARGESFRVFPLSNWTELDIWHYIYVENIPIVPLYYAAEYEYVNRGGVLLRVGDLVHPLPDETVRRGMLRYRTLGCQPCTGAVQSTASTLTEIIGETMLATSSERENRVVDQDREASMEQKKTEGYF